MDIGKVSTMTKRVITAHVHRSLGCWVIKFPDREIVARDRTMVRNLVRAYAKNHGVTATIDWGADGGIDK